MDTTQQSDLVKKINALHKVAKPLNINISQPGIIKELILADHLKLIVNPEKHNHDAVSVEEEYYEFMTSMESIRAYFKTQDKWYDRSQCEKCKDPEHYKHHKFVIPKFQVDRAKQSSLKKRFANIHYVIIAIFSYEDPLEILRIYQIELKKIEKRCDLFYENFSGGESNHLSISEDKIIRLQEDIDWVNLVYDKFYELCLNTITKKCKETNGYFAFTYVKECTEDPGTNNRKPIYNNRKPTYSNYIYFENIHLQGNLRSKNEGKFILCEVTYINNQYQANIIKVKDVDLNQMYQSLNQTDEIKKIVREFIS